MPPALVLLGLAYPLLAHGAIARGSDALALASAGLLVVLVLGPGLLRGRTLAWLLLLPAVAALVLLHRADQAALPLFAPPVVIMGGLAFVFARTLRGGHVPLIERFVRLLHPPGRPLDPGVPAYARRLTLAWALLLGSLALVNLVLALLASPGGLLLVAGVAPPVAVPRATWSLFANLLNYVLVGAFFLLEYAWRRRRFPDQPFDGFLDFARRTAAAGPRVFARAKRLPR